MRGVRAVRGGAIAVAAGILITLGVSAPAFASDSGDIFAATNSARAGSGLGGLALNGSLSSVAQAWANQMSANQTMSHNPSVAAQVPRGWQAVGENVATGFPSGAATVQGWLASAGHRANIMGNYTDIGIGWTVDANGVSWAVQVFARYPSAAAQAAAAQAAAQAAAAQAAAAQAAAAQAAAAQAAAAQAAAAQAAAAKAAAATSTTTTSTKTTTTTSTTTSTAASTPAASTTTASAPASDATSATSDAAAESTTSGTAKTTSKAKSAKTKSLFATATPQPRERLQAKAVDSTTPIDGGNVLFTTTLMVLIVLLGASLVSHLRRRGPRED